MSTDTSHSHSGAPWALDIPGATDARIVGTCSRCGGLVTTPAQWAGVGPAPVRCRGCGAHARGATQPPIRLPVIPMAPPAPAPEAYILPAGQGPKPRFDGARQPGPDPIARFLKGRGR